MSLDKMRERIDLIDEDLLRLLNERIRIAVDIGHLKRQTGGEVYVPAREKEVLKRVVERNPGPMTAVAVQSVYREIMSAALALEKQLKVAFLGPPATFTHQAARSRFGGSVEYHSCETIDDVFDAVQKEQADYGVVPVENSTEGAVNITLDRLGDTTLKIYAEIYLPISLCLLARCPRASIKTIYSKMEVFGQCRTWLQREMSGIECKPATSTTRAAELAAVEENTAAIGSRLAGELYGLDMLEPNIQDLGGNTTRFLVLGHRIGGATGDDKTSLFFAVQDKVGALYSALEAFQHNHLNMSKIESRPSRNKAWEYVFFVDLDGHAEDDNVKSALKEMREHCTLLTVLGSYPRAREL